MTTERWPGPSWHAGWHPDRASVEAFAKLVPGSAITVVKRAPDGSEAARYPATVAETANPSPWIELVAMWTLPQVVVAGLVFETGDTLREFFSAKHPGNAFAVYSPQGELRGWYGNVTYPAFMDVIDEEPVVVWHDLYLDVVILADGTVQLLDDDELEDSGLPAAEPGFAAAIVQARLDLMALIPALVPSQPGTPADPAGVDRTSES
jgi:hypothetical protein